MKTKATNFCLAACTLALATATTFPALADQATASAPNEKNYTGLVTSIDSQEHALAVKGWLFSKKSFNLGDTCAYQLLDKNPATATDLRVGQKVTVTYQDAHGVLIADRVTQDPMRYEGMVKSMDADKHTLTLQRSGTDKTLHIADNCQIMLRNDKTGSLSDIKTGDHVTVTYEKPGDTLTAREIAQTSITFTGKLTALDLNARTAKAETTFESKKFNVADNCAVVINGQTNGHLADLRLNEKLTFSYDEINGINIVNRIAPADEAAKPATANGPMAAN